MKKTKSLKDTFKMAPISNAFSLEIKNQREEALKNMEQLRKSVKLKKRANPLEKIMNKLMITEKDLTPSKQDNVIEEIKNEDTIKLPLSDMILNKNRANYTISIG